MNTKADKIFQGIGVFLCLAFLIIMGCQQGPVCNKPYILVGMDCCLDKDNNKICDSDEEVKQVIEVVKEIPVIKQVEEVKKIEPKEMAEEEPEIPVEKNTEEPETEEQQRQEFTPILSEEKGYAVRLIDYKKEIVSADKAKITEMELEIINNDPNNLWPSVNIYVYEDNDPLALKTFPEENIAPNYYIPSGYLIKKKYPASITVWNYDQVKNLKLSLHDQFDFDKKTLASFAIKINLGEGEEIPFQMESVLKDWYRDAASLHLQVKEVKVRKESDTEYILESVNIEVENKNLEPFRPKIQLKVADALNTQRFNFEDVEFPTINLEDKQEIVLDINEKILTPKQSKNFVFTIKNPESGKELLTMTKVAELKEFLDQED